LKNVGLFNTLVRYNGEDLGTHLFVKVPRPGDTEVSSCQVKLPPVPTCLSNNSKVYAIPLNALPKDTTSELADLSSLYPFFMLNVKQGICEYQPYSLLV